MTRCCCVCCGAFVCVALLWLVLLLVCVYCFGRGFPGGWFYLVCIFRFDFDLLSDVCLFVDC